MGDENRDGPIERTARTFPLSEWAGLASRLGDGWPLPEGVDWDSYTVELIDRLLTDSDSTHGPGDIVPQHVTFEDAVHVEERDEEGELVSLKVRGGRAWRHVRTVVRHPEVTARLQWEWDGTPFGNIAIAGLEEDPDPARSCRILLKAIQLLRDDEWRGQAKAGRPELTDDDVRRDLEVALERCHKDGKRWPSLSQLADAHDQRYDQVEQIAGLSERALRDRMRKHPGPFHDLVPWIEQRKKT